MFFSKPLIWIKHASNTLHNYDKRTKFRPFFGTLFTFVKVMHC